MNQIKIKAPEYQRDFLQVATSIEERLATIAPALSDDTQRVRQAIRYSLLDGGKRLRPVATVITAEALGAPRDSAIDTACAIEMVHTASLIIDDLPCMDDATQRRSKPANHLVYGEPAAILGAITLISEAFSLIGSTECLPHATRSELVRTLADAIGVEGLCAGQERDLHAPVLNESGLASLHQQKTGALFVACIEAGALIAGRGGAAIEPLRAFGQHAGLAFQILDDVLDQAGDAESLGKDVAQDDGKVTFATALGIDGAIQRAEEELDAALAALVTDGIDSGPFAAFLDLVAAGFRAGRSSRESAPA